MKNNLKYPEPIIINKPIRDSSRTLRAESPNFPSMPPPPPPIARTTSDYTDDVFPMDSLMEQPSGCGMFDNSWDMQHLRQMKKEIRSVEVPLSAGMQSVDPFAKSQGSMSIGSSGSWANFDDESVPAPPTPPMRNVSQAQFPDKSSAPANQSTTASLDSSKNSLGNSQSALGASTSSADRYACFAELQEQIVSQSVLEKPVVSDPISATTTSPIPPVSAFGNSQFSDQNFTKQHVRTGSKSLNSSLSAAPANFFSNSFNGAFATPSNAPFEGAPFAAWGDDNGQPFAAFPPPSQTSSDFTADFFSEQQTMQENQVPVQDVAQTSPTEAQKSSDPFSLNLFADLDPLGTGKSKPLMSKAEFFAVSIDFKNSIAIFNFGFTLCRSKNVPRRKH